MNAPAPHGPLTRRIQPPIDPQPKAPPRKPAWVERLERNAKVLS